MTRELRPYQEEIVKQVLESATNDIVCLPTGGGKTVIAGEIIDRLNEAGETVVFVVPRLELIDQAESEFADCDFIWSDKTTLTGKKRIIASKDSLRTQCHKLPENVVLIIDECHISLKQSRSLVDKIKPKRVIGLTATPERMDGLALVKGKNSKLARWACWDDVIQTESVASLIDKGYLTKLRYYTKPIEGITEIKSDRPNAEELSEEQMTDIFDKNQIWGDIVECYEQYAIKDGAKRPALGFTTTIKMAERIAELFTERGYRFEVISGEMPVEERKNLIDALRSGEIDGLVNAQLLTYGFDCPPVSYAFSCRHIKSRPFWFQMVGRILRLSEGKTDTIFIDHGDSISEFAEPDCSLPILDPYIKWRSEGETKEQKAERKKKMKNVRETMKELQSLDPIDCALVEVTVEDTWQRMLKIIRRQREENERLKSQNEALKNLKDAQNSELQKMKEENRRLENKIKYQAKKDEPLPGPPNGWKLPYDRNDQRPEDTDGNDTYQFILKNYRDIRYKIRPEIRTMGIPVKERLIKEHEITVQKLWELAKNLDFKLAEWKFNSSLNFWQYTYKWT